MLKVVLISLVFFCVDFYAYQAIRTVNSSLWLKVVVLAVSQAATFLSFYIFMVEREAFSVPVSNLFVGLFIMLFAVKLVLIAFLLSEDLFRVSNLILQKLSTKEQAYMPSRRKLVSQLALGVAAIPFASLLYGVVKGKYNFKVLKYTLHFKDLPEAFDGYQLTQISDLHCGSFDNPDKIRYGIDLINQQQSDAILFTGDLVNLKASEILPWKSELSRLKAKDGVYSVMGNHDYGEYVQWDNKQEKHENLEQLKSLQKEMGYKLLLNQSAYLQRDKERIALVGVENWGKGSIQKGNLKQATTGLDKDDFTVLLSHDPTHWEEEVLNSEKHIHLTLSGHTHGMQFGIEIPGWIKWSPIKWRYKQWAGLYEKAGKYINVNRGFGFLAFPGRTGIWPEITVINLKRST